MDILFNAAPAEISAIVQAILAIAMDIPWSRGKAGEAETALREALSDAVLKGRQNPGRRKVRCRVACDPEQGVMIILLSPGKRARLAPLPGPVVGRSLYSEQGLRICLVDQLDGQARHCATD